MVAVAVYAAPGGGSIAEWILGTTRILYCTEVLEATMLGLKVIEAVAPDNVEVP